MKEYFRVKKVEIKDTHFARCFEPRFRVRVSFCILDEHGIESITGREEKSCSKWADVESFISRCYDKEEARSITENVKQ